MGGQEGKAEREANWDANAVETGRLNRAAQKERDDRNLQHYAKGTQYRRRRLVERHEINAAMQQIYENKGSVTPAELIDTLESQGKGTLGIMKASKSVSRFRRKQAKEDEQAQSEFQAKIARGQEGKAEREANWDANAVETGRLNRAAQKERDDRNLQHYAKGTQYRRRR